MTGQTKKAWPRCTGATPDGTHTSWADMTNQYSLYLAPEGRARS